MNINKILFLFLSVMALSIFGLWQFAHTEKFADFLSSKLKTTFLKNFRGKVSFESIEIGVFPLSTKIKNFSLKVPNKNGKDIYCNFDEVGFYFSPVDLLSSKIIIAKAVVDSGFVRHGNERFLPNSSNSRLRIEEIFSYYKQTRIGKALQRIKTIQIKNANLDDLVDVDDIRIQTYSNYIVLMGDLGKINVEKFHRGLGDGYENVWMHLEIEKKKIRVKNLEIKDKLDLATFKGELKELERGHEIKGTLAYQGRLEKIFDLAEIKLSSRNKFLGYVDMNAKISGDIKKPVFKVDVRGKRIESPYFIADNMEGSFSMTSDKIVIRQVNLKRKNGTVRLLEPVEIFDIKNKKFILGNAQFEVRDFFSHEAFRALKFLDIVNGRISGVVGFEWTRDNFVISPHAGLHFKNFKIKLKDEEIPILKNERMTFNGGTIVVEHDDEVYAEFDIDFPGCRFKGKGVVDKNGIDFLIDDSTIDFGGLGKVAGVKMHGRGDFSMGVVGPFNDVWFDFGFDLDDFEISGYKFNNIDGNARLSLKNKSLYFKKIRSVQKKSRLLGNGNLSFKGNTQLDLNVKAEKISLVESYFLAGPVFNPLKKKLQNIKANYSGNVSIKIDFKNDNVEVGGSVYTDEITLYNDEYLDALYSKFIYKNKKIFFENIDIRKGGGSLKGRLEIDTGKDSFKYQAKLSNLEIGELYLYRLLNLQYRGRIFGESRGEGTLKHYHIKTDLMASQGYIGKIKVQDGRLIIRADQDNFKMQGNLLGDIVRFESSINFGKKNSYFKGKIDAPEIGVLMGLISKRNISNNMIQGNARATWNISFELMPLKIIDIDLAVEGFTFKYDRLALDLVNGRNRIVVKNSKVKNWNIGIMGKNNFITSVGSGDLSSDFKIKQEFKLDALLGMLFSSQIDNVYGELFGQHVATGENNEVKSNVWFESKDIFLKIKGLVDSFSKIKFRVSISEQNAVLEKFSAIFGDGAINGVGHIILNIPQPAVDLNFKMESSKISFFKKSGIVASANIDLKGNKIPYVLDGKVSILHGSIKDEIKDILENFSTYKSYNKYIPEKTNNNVFRYLNYNLDINTFSPVTVSNSLFDFKIKGEGKIGGSLDNPLLDGKLDVVKGDSKIMFKNHDFVINEGGLVFNDMSDGNKAPRIKLVGAVDVDDYNIKLNVFGDVNSTQVELSSVPPLPQQDILSLLALGVTTTMDKDLNEKDRQSITTLSFGSLVVEQLKLHEGLTSSLGLRLSIQPEFQENQTGPLEGRLDKKESSEKIKTATKVKVQKKIAHNVDLSLSSTLGDANEQKQIMNIIYQVNKNLSLEGIYEINSSDTAVEESLNSGGVDIKYRISF